MLEYNFRNAAQYIEAWEYLMRLGLGFRCDNTEGHWNIQINTEQDDLQDSYTLKVVKARLDNIVE